VSAGVVRSADALSRPTAVVHPGGTSVAEGLRELWDYRELVYFLVWRDVKVRYKQTALGALWAILQPLLTMGVFSVVFGWLARMPSDGAPYPVFAYVALLPWNLFAHALGQTAGGVVGSQYLVQRIYFPRLVIPLAGVLGGLVDFALAFAVLVGMLVYYGQVPSLAVLTLPLFLLFAIITALAVGLWLSVINVRYRDVRYVMGFVTQFWLFATPVVYPASLVPEAWRWVLGLNPMAGVVEGFRWALLGSAAPSAGVMAVSVVVVIGLLVGGVLVFHRGTRTLADLV
jgi:lipopolysaccharide transport system permease protein